MFSPDDRTRVRDRVLAHARHDERVTGGAVTGSAARDTEDRWSDVDLAFALAAGVDPEALIDDWSDLLEQELGVVHHWDLCGGSTIYRVFLLQDGRRRRVPRERFRRVGPSLPAHVR